MRVSKFDLNIPYKQYKQYAQYTQHINNMHTKFQQSGKFQRSEMHRGGGGGPELDLLSLNGRNRNLSIWQGSKPTPLFFKNGHIS